MYRPGGLTALAVINFVIAGLFGLLGLLMMLAMATGGAKRPAGVSESFMTVQTFFWLTDAGLLVLAGIGYLKMKRGMGRWLGTGEAGFSLLFFGYAMSYTLGQGMPFQFSSLQQLVYPGIALVLLNWVFRENLVN